MTTVRRPVKASGDVLRGFASEDGFHYRTHHQELAPAMRRVQEIRDLHSQATRASNPNEWQHLGSIPKVVLHDWLMARGYDWHDFATNAGGDPYDKKGWASGKPGVRNDFLRYFFSRDFSKLHNQHVTTKRESSQVLMTRGVRDATEQLRRAKG